MASGTAPATAIAAAAIPSAAAAAPARAIVGNRNHLPLYLQNEGTSRVYNFRIRRKAASNANWSNLQLTYAGFQFSAGAETALPSAFTLRAGLEYQGAFYAVNFSGARDKVIPAGATVAQSDVVALSLPAGAVYFERVRFVLSTLYGDNFLVTHEADLAFGEWLYSGNDEAVDYTLGGAPIGDGAQAYFEFSGSTLTGIQVTSGGSGYPGAFLTIYAFDPDAGAHTSSAGYILNVPVSNGVAQVGHYTSGFVSGNVNGWGPNTLCVFNPFTGPSAIANRAYCASLVTGIPDRPVASLIINGDSNGAGFGSSDGIGDANRNYGIYERALHGSVGIGNFSFPGAQVADFLDEARYPLSHRLFDGLATHVLLEAAGNDIGAGHPAAQVLNDTATVAAAWRSRGAAVGFATSLPRTTGTYTSAAGQAPVAGFAAGGALDTYNAAVKYAQGAVAGDFRPILVYDSAVDPATPNVWRSDGGAYTTDGTHPGSARGLARIAAAMSTPSL